MSTLPTNTNNQKQDDSPTKERKKCNGGCGFYGSPETLDYCSICYNKCVPEEQRKDVTKNENNKTTNDNNTNTENTTDENKPKRKKQKKRNRCWQCKKKMTLAGTFECKCGYTFCGVHRYADTHECDFDYKSEHTDRLNKQLDKVAPSKFEKI